MTPSATIIAAAIAQETLADADGRQLTIRRMTALDRLRLFKAAGPLLSQNQPWLGMAVIASSVVAIDDVPMPQPITEAQIEAMVTRLGDAGIAAIARALQPAPEPSAAETVDAAGN
ncbi:MAG: hypothetical protein WDN25_09310 [Acetobacteraceae bacterium]